MRVAAISIRTLMAPFSHTSAHSAPMQAAALSLHPFCLPIFSVLHACAQTRTCAHKHARKRTKSHVHRCLKLHAHLLEGCRAGLPCDGRATCLNFTCSQHSCSQTNAHTQIPGLSCSCSRADQMYLNTFSWLVTQTELTRFLYLSLSCTPVRSLQHAHKLQIWCML